MAALKHANSDQSLYLMPEFQKRLNVLRSLQYIDEEETVLLKVRSRQHPEIVMRSVEGSDGWL